MISFPPKGGAISQEKVHLLLSLVHMKKMFYSKWHENIRYRILKCSVLKQFCLLPMDFENKQIGEKLDLPREIVSKWRKRFFEERLDGLQDRPRRGRPSRFSP